MKKLIYITGFFAIIFSTAINQVCAQNARQDKKAKKEAAIKSMIDAQHFSFEAQTAIPTDMKSRQLTFGYELKIRKDTIDVYLPYYGKAYVAPIGSSDEGIKFKTTDFKYVTEAAKKGGWNIMITPKSGDTRQLFLSVSADGNATLQVTSNNRQSISFFGIIQQ